MAQHDKMYAPLLGPLSIRLLRLDCQSGPLRATLSPMRLDQVPAYYALSYCWGTVGASTTITVNGYSLPITPSLAEALFVLRANSAVADTTTISTVNIWIDQICIDQSNLEERGQQVGIMKEIYSFAKRTVIWLGADADFAESAFGVCRSIYARFQQENPDAHNLATLPWKPFDEQEHLARGLPALDDSCWKHLQAMFSSPWWRRLWIFQEVVLSSRDPLVLCGSSSCSWESLAWSACWLWNYGYFDHGVVSISVSCANSILEVSKTQAEWHVGALLHMSHGYFKATDARDKVYGLLGMSHQIVSGSEEAILVDYGKSTGEVYRDAAWHVMSSTKNLAVLSLALCRVRSVWDPYRSFGRQMYWNDSASWTPNFDYFIAPNDFTSLEVANTGHQGFSMTKLAFRPQYQAAKGLSADVYRSRTPHGKDCVSIKGLRVDTIQECLEINTPRGLSLQVQRLRTWPFKTMLASNRAYISENSHLGRWRLGLHYLYSYISGLKRPAALRMWEATLKFHGCINVMETAQSFLRATTAGVTPEHEDTSDANLADMCAYLANLYDAWDHRYRHSSAQHGLQFLRAHAQDGDPDRYRIAMEEACVIRRFFITGQGYLGIGPTGLKRQDSVCVLFGGGTPFILRQVEDHWLLVGAGYVSDIMEGHAIDAWYRRTGPRAEMFEIH
jgi:hypothetical protein